MATEAQLTFEQLLKGLQGQTTATAGKAGRLTAEEYAAAEARAAARAADVAANQVNRSAGVEAATKYLGRGARAAAPAAARGTAGSVLRFLGKRALGPAGLGLLAYEGLQGAAKLGAGIIAPERPAFVPPEVHKQIMDRLGPNGYDLLKGEFTGEPVGPLKPGRVKYNPETLKGSIPSSQPAADTGPVRKPVDLNALDNPDVPLERGTGVIRNNTTGRTFAIDARDTVNHQFDDVAVGAEKGLRLPKTGYADLDASMPGIVNYAIANRQNQRAQAAAAVQQKDQTDFLQSLVLERLKQSAPNVKVLDPQAPGDVPQVVTTNPATGTSNVQAALPPGQTLQTLDESSKRSVAKGTPLAAVNAMRQKYGLQPIPE